ncbi:hypothetical protein, partial [Yersinia intermedia]|uniref:hypothetical protein n=1 Tax=Yersinia intermedia TaxID=631 RepID=UPI001C97B37B
SAPSGMLVLTKKVRRLDDLPAFTATGTLSLTSNSKAAFNYRGLACFYRLKGQCIKTNLSTN